MTSNQFRRVAACLSLLCASACTGTFSAIPNFEISRAERIGEPFSILPSESKPIFIETLKDGRKVQAMPLYVVKRAADSLMWSRLTNAVHARAGDHGADNANDVVRARLFVVNPEAPQSGAKNGQGRVSALQGVDDPLGDLAREQSQFLNSLDSSAGSDAIVATTVLLVCVPPTGPAFARDALQQCFVPGGTYDLTVNIRSFPPAVFPFSVELHNDVVGAFIGFFTTLLLVGYAIS